MDLRRLSINPQLKVFLLIDQFSIISMRKLILQIRLRFSPAHFACAIYKLSFRIRHFCMVFFAFYSNFPPHTRIYFCKSDFFLLNWNLLFQFTKLSN